MISIKNQAPSGFPLRLADARPYINAKANSMQGKGFENINALGGASIATIVFLDIQNIHIVRDSLNRFRDHFYHDAFNNDLLLNSKWTTHIATILRASVAIADSLSSGYPVLVHCSDGWDRTSQLSGISQIMLDPYHRTVKGLLVLIEKEWASFGHKVYLIFFY